MTTNKYYEFCDDLRELFQQFSETVIIVNEDGDTSKLNVLRWVRFLQDMEAPTKLVEIVKRHYNEEYYELLYAVGSKYPDESRHQTALRYINEQETAANEICGTSRETD